MYLFTLRVYYDHLIMLDRKWQEIRPLTMPRMWRD